MFSEFLYASSIKATVILSAAALLAFFLRKGTASARYMTWTIALASSILAPVLATIFARQQIEIVAQAITVASKTAASSAPVAAGTEALDWAVPLWLAGFSAMGCWMAAGRLRLHLLLRRTRPVSGQAWQELVTEVAHSRQVRLLVSSEVDVPISCGLLKPVIVIDTDTESASQERRRVVLLHEMTHIRRHDAWLSLAAQTATALHWFNPLAWYAYSRFRQEQERSCDDAVVNGGVNQNDYARHLVDVARQVKAARPRFSQGLSMARPRGFEQRVMDLLQPRNRVALSNRAIAASIAAAAFCIVPLAALRGQAAGQAGSVAGAVSDASGARVPKAQITLKSQDGKRQEIARADLAGEFTLPHVAAGVYDIEVRAPGFSVLQHKNVDVQPGQLAHLDLQLALGQISETLEIVGKGVRPAPPAPAGTPKRIRVGGNVQATKLLKMVRPAYPVNAQSAGTEGPVLLRAVISTTGDLIGLTVLNTADAELARAAMEAVQQWKYQPTLLNGVPVEVVTTVTLNFRLEQ